MIKGDEEIMTYFNQCLQPCIWMDKQLTSKGNKETKQWNMCMRNAIQLMFVEIRPTSYMFFFDFINTFKIFENQIDAYRGAISYVLA